MKRETQINTPDRAAFDPLTHFPEIKGDLPHLHCTTLQISTNSKISIKHTFYHKKS